MDVTAGGVVAIAIAGRVVQFTSVGEAAGGRITVGVVGDGVGTVVGRAAVGVGTVAGVVVVGKAN